MRTINQNLLDEIVQRIVTALHPETIYLYGSHAYGKPHQDSDVDILIVIRESSVPSYKRAVQVYRALRGLFLPAEVKVVTRAEFDRRIQWLTAIERVIKEKGKILYESKVG